MSSLGILMLSTFNFLQASGRGCTAHVNVSGCPVVASKGAQQNSCVAHLDHVVEESVQR